MRRYRLMSFGLLCAALGFLCFGSFVVAAAAAPPGPSGGGLPESPPGQEEPATEAEEPGVVEGREAGTEPGPGDAGRPDSPPQDKAPAAETDGPRDAQGRKAGSKPKRGGAGPSDPPSWYKKRAPETVKGPSVVRGKRAGIEVGQYAPDFELQPVEPYPSLRDWLVDEALQVVYYQRPRRFRVLGLLPRWRGRVRAARVAYSRKRVNDPESPDALQRVRLSQLVGKQPILLLYGSYT